MSRYLLVSADGHAGPPAEHYREYLDPVYHQRFDEHQAEAQRLRAARPTSPEFRKEWEAVRGDVWIRAAYDSDARNQELDYEGVVAEVLFPDADVLGTGRIAASPFGSGLSSSGNSDPELVMAGARAHNRWMADFASQCPARRIGLAIVPILHDIEAAVAEIREAHALGLRGVVIPTRWMSEPAYNHPRYEPVWSVCEELSMVLHTHSGVGPTDYVEGPGLLGIYTTEVVWWAARSLWVLLWAGVFERYPGLRFGVVEDGAFWLPDILMKMDERWLGDHATKKFGDDVFRADLKMKPSEYFHRNCFLGASTPHVVDIERRHAIGIENLLWGSDMPHSEGSYPHTRKFVRDRFAGVAESETRRILGLNAVEIYGLDIAELTAIAEKIGPTVEDIHGQER